MEKNKLEFDFQIIIMNKMKEKLKIRIQKFHQEIVFSINLIKDLEDKCKELE